MLVEVQPKLVAGAVVWKSGVVVDADGAYDAYRLDDQGLDALKNAKCSDGGWCGAVTVDPNDKFSDPVIQGPGDPCPGSLVSPTSLSDPSLPRTNPRRYVDAASFPYFAISPELRKAFGVDFGDLGILVYGDALVAAICADGCPHSHLGEVSIAAAVGAGLNGSPRIGGCDRGASFVIFPGSKSSPRWPRRVVDFQLDGMSRFDRWGGRQMLAHALAA